MSATCAELRAGIAGEAGAFEDVLIFLPFKREEFATVFPGKTRPIRVETGRVRSPGSTAASIDSDRIEATVESGDCPVPIDCGAGRLTV